MIKLRVPDIVELKRIIGDFGSIIGLTNLSVRLQCFSEEKIAIKCDQPSVKLPITVGKEVQLLLGHK